jgi:HEAT repeat protein
LPGILVYIQRADRDEIFSASLIRLLAACRDPGRIPVLIKLLKNSSPLVRAAAVMTLSQDVTPQVVIPLLEAAKDNYAVVRIQAGAALARFPASQMKRGDSRDRRARRGRIHSFA